MQRVTTNQHVSQLRHQRSTLLVLLLLMAGSPNFSAGQEGDVERETATSSTATVSREQFSDAVGEWIRRPRDVHQFGFEQLDSADVMQILAKVLALKKRPIPAHRRVSDSSEWPEHDRFARVLQDGLLLAEPTLSPDENFRIVTDLHRDEVLAVLDVRQRVVFDNPTGPVGTSSGDWARLSTADGKEGWLFAAQVGGPPLAAIYSKPVQRATQQQAPASSNSLDFAPIVLIAILVLIALGIVGVFSRGVSQSSRGRTAPTRYYETRGDEDMGAIDGEEPDSGRPSVLDVVASRRGSLPKQGFLETDSSYRERIYREGKENTVSGLSGAPPKARWFETEEAYKSRIAHEANELIVSAAADSAPKQRFLEGDDEYRARMFREANEQIVAAASGDEPKQGWFETDDDYVSRVSHEANEHIVEASTGEAPRKGFFETDEGYEERIREEAREIRARRDDD